MGFSFLNQLPTTEEVKKQYPLSKELRERKAKRDAEMKSIFRGESKKFLLVIGPCSADHEDPVLEYCHRLKEVAKDVEDRIFIVPRIYTNKPRTTGEGYKGMRCFTPIIITISMMYFPMLQLGRALWKISNTGWWLPEWISR